MNKKKTTEPMTLQMTIELADNGIIIRNPECGDEVTLALEKGGYTECIDHSDEYTAIGKKVYDWLINILLAEQDPREIITTGFDLNIVACCCGREP